MDHLEKNEGKQIIRLLSGLFTFANVKDGLHLKEFGDTQSYLLKGARKVFYDAQSSKAYIEEYLEANQSMKYRDQDLLKQWMGAFKQELYLFGTQKQYTYAYVPAEKRIYGIKGLTDSFASKYHGHPLPVRLDYAILPYQGGYICDAIDQEHGMLQIPKAVEIYEAFRSAGLAHGVKTGEDTIDPIIFCDRDHAGPDEVFTDFLQPFLLLAQAKKELLHAALKEGAKAWNLSLESKEKIAEATSKDSENAAFIDLCIKRRKQVFPHASFMIQEFDSVMEHGTIKIHIKESTAVIQ